jgi:hypothetical protein
MNMIKKLSAIIIIILIIFSLILIAGCAGDSDNSTNPAENNGGNASGMQNGGENGEETAATENIVYTPNFEIKDWEGRAFTFLTTGVQYDYYETIDIAVEEITGEVFNDAVFERNQAFERKYNVVINEIKTGSVGGDAQNAIRAGDDIYDAIFAMTWESVSLAQGGFVLEINEVPNIDLTQPWWDQNVISDLSIANKTYFVTGDISVMDDNSTMLFFFNQKLIQDYNLESPYQLLDENKWTFDEYAKLVRAVSTDLNGDGIMDENDRFGNVLAYHYIQYMVQGSGMRYAELDRDGFPHITFMSERTVAAVDNIFNLYFDTDINAIINRLNAPGGINQYTFARQLFANDQFLFVLSQPLIFYEFRDMDSNFGIMPVPKHDSAQERYYSPVDTACTFLSVPTTAADPEFAGYVLEAFSAESKNILTPAYYEVMLQRKFTRDEKSSEILDIVSQSRLYDLGIVYNWGGINEIIASSFQRSSADIMSAYERSEERIKTAAERTFEAFLNNNQ